MSSDHVVDRAQLHALAQQRSHLVRHGFTEGAEHAIALSDKCDALAEAAFGRLSRDFAASLQWSASTFQLAAAEKGGGRKAKKEMQHAIALLRESATTIEATTGDSHPELARALFNLSTALASTGSKPEYLEAIDVHRRAMRIFWRVRKRPAFNEASISTVTSALAKSHLEARVHVDSHAVAALLSDAIRFEEAGAAGLGGPLSPAAHSLRLSLAHVLEAGGDFAAAIVAAKAACSFLAQGVKPSPSDVAAAQEQQPQQQQQLAGLAGQAPGRSVRPSPEQLALQQESIHAERAASAELARQSALALAISQSEASSLLASLERRVGRRREALASEKRALELLTVPASDASSSRRGSGKGKALLNAAAKRGAGVNGGAASGGIDGDGSGHAAPASATKFADGAMAAGCACRMASDVLELALAAKAVDSPLQASGPVAAIVAPSGAIALPVPAAPAPAVSAGQPPPTIADAAAEIGRALQLATELGGEESPVVAEVLVLASRLCEAQHDLASAVEAQTQAARVIKATSGESSAQHARCVREQVRLLSSWSHHPAAPRT